MKNYSAFLVLIFVFLKTTCFQAQEPVETALSSISATDLQETVSFLCSEELEGRLSGSVGYNKAAAYAAGRFRKLGLAPKGDSAYFQHFTVEYNRILEPCSFSMEGNEGVIETFQPVTDFVCRGFTGSGKVRSEVVFVGYGMDDSLNGFNEYTVDVVGKIVMMFKHEPSWKNGDDAWPVRTMRQKVAPAIAHGAKGVLFVSKPNDTNPQAVIGSVMAGDGEHPGNFPQLHISLDAAEEILKQSGLSLSSLQSLIDSTKQPASVQLNTICEINVKAEYIKEQRTMNVVAALEGSDPELKKEYVILGAHLDHVGKQGEKIFFPGANDNASGAAAVLEVAEAFAKAGIKPKRSVLFVLFACEEHGLDGARFCAEHLPFPEENLTAMLNMDCVAYGDSIKLGCGKAFPDLWNLARKLDNKYTQRSCSDTWGGGGADATPFFEKGVPTLYFVTTNSYKHLHLTTDRPETLNYELFVKITKLAFLSLFEIAQGNYTREVSVVK